MKAVGIKAYGGPENIAVVDLSMPEPGEGEIRVRIAAAAVGPADLAMLAGAYANFTTGPAPWVGGTSAAGTVDAVGPQAKWQVGDKVVVHVGRLPHCRGAHAEYAVVHSDQAGRLPDGVSPEQASTLPVVGLTALAALDCADLEPGQTLAVTGAAGGVGSAVVQLAAARGICVVGTAAKADADRLTMLGADHAIDRDSGDTAACIREIIPEGVDALIDAARLGSGVLGAIRDGGIFVDLTGMGMAAERDIAVRSVMVGRDHLMCRDRLELLAAIVEQGGLELKIAEVLPPERGSEAYVMVRDRPGSHGRVIISFPG